MQLPRVAARLSLAMVIALTLAATPWSVAACSCASGTPEQMAAASDAVFTGSVLAVEQVPALGADDFAGMHDLLYTFGVDGVVKGDLPDEVVLVGGSSGASCGMSFAADTRYLVFASLDRGNLVTNLCSGNVPLEGDEAGPLPARAPEPAPTEPAPTEPAVPIAPIILGGIVLVLAGLSLAAFRRTAR